MMMTIDCQGEDGMRWKDSRALNRVGNFYLRHVQVTQFGWSEELGMREKEGKDKNL